MALGDPFDATLRAAQERSQGIERGFGVLGESAQQFGMQAYKGQQEKELQAEKTELELGKEFLKTMMPTTYTYTDPTTGKPITYTQSNQISPEQFDAISKTFSHPQLRKMFEAVSSMNKKSTSSQLPSQQISEDTSGISGGVGGELSKASPQQMIAGRPVGQTWDATKPLQKYEETLGQALAPQTQPAQNVLPAGASILTQGGKTKFIPPSSSYISQEHKTKMAKNIADGIADGSIPADPAAWGGFGTTKMEVVNALQEKGVDFNKSYYDSMAMKKSIQGLNAPQQIRLRQVLQYGQESIPILRELSKEFSRFNWTPANAAELKAAMTDTAVDPALRDAATRFSVQYETMRSDLAQAFAGGYAPTVDSYQLADNVMNKLWGHDQLSVGLDQLGVDLAVKKSAAESIVPMGLQGAVQQPGGMGQQIAQVSGTQPTKIISDQEGYQEFLKATRGK